MVNLRTPLVILLAGSEQFLKQDALVRLKSAFLDRASGDFNFNVFYANSTPLEKVLECASTAPFLGRKRLVLVRGVEDFSASDKECILSFVKAGRIKHSLLILETAQSNLHDNFLNQIAKFARVIFCKPLEGRQLLTWVKAQVELKGKKIEKNAQTLLIENLGSSLKLLANSLDALSLYIGEKGTIEVEDVEKLVGPDLSTSAFELFDACVAGDKERIFGILDSLFKDGINSSQILGAFAHKMISERNRIKPSLFEEVFLNLQKTDTAIKTGRQTQRLALELLMARLSGIF